MDNIFEIIIPVIFAAIYFFGNMLSKKTDEEGTPSRGQPRRAEDSEAAERQRRIQDEIRRKIMERRGHHPEQAERRPHSSAEPVLREGGRPRPQSSAEPVEWEGGRPSQAEPATVYQQSSSDEYDIQAKLQQIEATKRRAEKLKKQARASDSQAQSSHSSRSTSLSQGLRGPVRSTLSDPAAARAAFIYGEVLGPPISQKKTQTVPGLA